MQELQSLIAEFKQTIELRKETEKEVARLISKQRELKEKIIPILINNDLQEVRYPKIGGVSLKVNQFPKVEDKEKFFTYLSATKQDSIIKTSVNYLTLRSWWTESGINLAPEEIGLSIYKEVDINLLKGK